MNSKLDFQSKDIVFYDKESGRFKNYSIEEVHARSMNNWKGWWCSAGIDSLYIDFDGNIFAGTCQVGGWYGNVFQNGPKPDSNFNKWQRCNISVCACGSDIKCPKVKASEPPKDMGSFWRTVPIDPSKYTSDLEQTDSVFSYYSKQYRHVIWDLGRRCNYACTYCYPDAHNNYEAHKTIGSLKHAVDFLRNYWSPTDPIKFIIAGGEPTINPHYLELAEYIKKPRIREHDKSVFKDGLHTTTNGSRTADFYKQLASYSNLVFSLHLEYLKTEEQVNRLLETLETCALIRKNDPHMHLNFWYGARLMMPPGSLAQAKMIWERMNQNEVIKTNLFLSKSVVHETAEKKLSVYSTEELDFINQA